MVECFARSGFEWLCFKEISYSSATQAFVEEEALGSGCCLATIRVAEQGSGCQVKMEGEEEDQVEKIGECNVTKERSVQRNASEVQTISWGTDTVSTQKVNERNTDYVIELVNSFGSHKRSNEDVDRSNSLMR